MTYSVVWTATAKRDLQQISRYIAQDSIDNALAILERLQYKAAELTELPQRGRLLPELLDTGVSHYREILSKPWRIIYRIEQQTVIVIAVLDSRRNLQTILLNRLGS